MDEGVWDATLFTKNRERLLAGDIDQWFFMRVLEQARERGLLSDEHFTVDGTLVEAWAGQKSFEPRGGGQKRPPEGSGNPTVNFKGEKRSNETHVSRTDPQARLYRKSFGTESKLCYAGHILMDNRHGLAVDATLSLATGGAEREVGVEDGRRARRDSGRGAWPGSARRRPASAHSPISSRMSGAGAGARSAIV